MSGLDALRAIAAGRVPPPPFAELLNFALVEVEEGRAVFEGTPGEEHYNPLATVHGGYAMTLCDSAMTCAVQTLLPAGVGATTTDAQIRLIRPMTKETGRVRCEGVALHVGRSTAVAEAKLRDGEGRLLGVATTACAILRPR